MDVKVYYEPLTFPDNSYPHGLLPKDLGAQACWYNFIKLHKAYKEAGDTESQIGKVLEGDLWKVKCYIEIKRSTALIYGLDPDHIDKFWSVVRAEAERLGKERFLILNEPFEMPESEYINAKPGMTFGGHSEGGSRS